MVHGNTTWPEERVDILKRMWADGYSAQQIADCLPGVSRSAVLGKADRLKLADRRQGKTVRHTVESAIARKRIARKPVTLAAPAPPKPKPPIPTVHLSTITGTIITGPKPVPPRPLPEPAPASGPLIDIHAITSRNCCWPVERGGEFDEWMFCGGERDPKSGSHDRGYCTKHWHRATQPSGRRAA
jgi:GcrA cell cycle regulator